MILCIGLRITVLLFLSLGIANAADCAFQSNPSEYLSRATRAQRDIFNTTSRFAAQSSLPAPKAAAPEIPIRNFIDEEIFGNLARSGVSPARLTTDEEFFRRINLDLTGRLPSPQEVRDFVADSSPGKRDDLIDRLLYSTESTDRWTLWFGDLFQNVVFPANFDRQINGRNAFYTWIRSNVARSKSLQTLATEAVTHTGNDYDSETGGVNFALNSIAPSGPIQDMFDLMLKNTATAFLGMSHYDCLLCHNGRGHLDAISSWGAGATRVQAQKMAAFFARQRATIQTQLPTANFYYNSYILVENPTGTYDLNTNFGNRPDRLPAGTVKSLTPEYHFTAAAPASGSWRAAFAANMVQDPMFARNFANRLWREMFGLALVEPVDSLDPARLDPENPPEDPWTLQATHPVLLEKLAKELAARDFSLREFVRLLVQSSAYQLSSRYDGVWKYEYTTLFARHYPRRLQAEEIHDAVTKSTGVLGSYKLTGFADPFLWAMKFPDPGEPRVNGSVANFLNTFLRGNRDTQQRSEVGSILQQLALMNDSFVTARVKVSASPSLQAIVKIADNGVAADELFLLFLSRLPSDSERAAAQTFLAQSANPSDRSTRIEDLAWACINKVDFLFSY